jgi:hypothetical protein
MSDISKTLNSKISLTCNGKTDLNRDGKFSMIDIPQSHIKSTHGKLCKRYWIFDADKPFNFTIEPLDNIPEKK